MPRPVPDETGFLKKGIHFAGVQRGSTVDAGRIGTATYNPWVLIMDFHPSNQLRLSNAGHSRNPR